MKRLSRPRRSLWLVLGLVIGVLATAATMAVAGLQPADLNFTPRTEAQTTNVDVARAWAKNYYGAHTAVAGPNGTWYTPLNLESNYANEARSVADQSDHWLSARRHVPHRAIVLDVDDTTLTTWNYELYSNWDFNPTTNAQFVGITTAPSPGTCSRRRRGWSTWPTMRGPWATHLLDHRARRFAARRDDREPRGRQRGRATGDRRGHAQRAHDSGGRRRLSAAHADRHRPRRVHRRPLHEAAGRLVPGLSRHARVLRAVHRRRASPARPSSTSPGPARTSSRRATTSSPTSATSSATSRATSRTRCSRCRTRTTTSRRGALENRTEQEPLPFAHASEGSGLLL